MHTGDVTLYIVQIILFLDIFFKFENECRAFTERGMEGLKWMKIYVLTLRLFIFVSQISIDTAKKNKII